MPPYDCLLDPFFVSQVIGSTSLPSANDGRRRVASSGPSYDPVTIARSYESAGAAAISVLTEPTFFDGALEHLSAVRTAVATPLLRKDFVISEYQLLEARAAGADAVLLIVAALSDQELRHLLTAARSLGLDALVEVHDDLELSKAIDVGADVIGVNNRNLRTLAVDVEASERLIANDAVARRGRQRERVEDRCGREASAADVGTTRS